MASLSDKISSIPGNVEVDFGVYTPTVVGTTANFNLSNIYEAQWLKVGNVVTVSGVFQGYADTLGEVRFFINPPIPRNIDPADITEVAGAGVLMRGNGSSTYSFQIFGVDAGEAVRFGGTAAHATSTTAGFLTYTYTYRLT